MNEEAFNVSLRKFLKKVGITSQRLVPFELAVGKRGADGLLDFALRGNADLLEKFA